MNECSIIWYGKYQQKWENEVHAHNYFQIVMVLNGRGILILDNDRQAINIDRLYLFKPQQQHAINCDHETDTPLRILDIKFSVHDPLLHDDLIKVDCPLNSGNFRWLTNSFERIIHESREKKKHYYTLINVILYTMLVQLVRETVYGQTDRESVDQPPNELVVQEQQGINFEQIMNFIHGNYANVISLDDLVDLSKVGKTILINTFKSVYGVTPIRYINQLRLQKAKELLANTRVSVSEIAKLIGFQSVFYFSHTFKTKEKCTPTAYRYQHDVNQFYIF